MAEITFTFAVITSAVAKITFVVAVVVVVNYSFTSLFGTKGLSSDIVIL